MEMNKIPRKLVAAHHQIQTPNASKIIPNLSEDIIQEILSRLPVKFLLTLRCVSKAWCSLISSKHFIKTHLEYSKKDPNFTSYATISTFMPPDYRVKQCSLRSLLYEPSIDTVDLDYPTSGPENSVRVVGCCNGLCCLLESGKDLFLWNPSTRKFKKLPEIDPLVRMGGRVTEYGFGFDESNDDYRVLGVISVFWSFWAKGKYVSVAKLYSLKTNSWKVVENFNSGSPFGEAGILVSGKLHWTERVGRERFRILSFDLGTEEQAEVEQPSYDDEHFSSSFGELQGCLSVLCHYPKTRADIWVLKQYGVKESWVKVVSVPYLDPYCHPWGRPTPLFITQRGDILFIYKSTFLIFDPTYKVFKDLCITNFDEFLDANVYVQSLVSPFSDNEQQNAEGMV